MRWCAVSAVLVLALLPTPAPAHAQQVTIDVSASHAMYRILLSLKDGASKDEASRMLDSVLATRAYRTMFRHYNRSWRPDHLPEAVFKRMILSLRFPAEYSVGENQRADAMLPGWRRFYGDLALYAANLKQLDQTDLRTLITQGVHYAQTWLPPEWRIPDFYLPILPHGGSRAFTIDTAQGYDFLQLARDSAGVILWSELVSTIAHESHHLGVKARSPGVMSLADSVAFEFVSIFMAEGTATKFVNDFPGGCVPRIDGTRRDPAYTPQVAEWWQRYTAKEAELFDRLVKTFEGARAGTLSRDSLEAELAGYWLDGYVSPVYFVGAELFGAIYHGYGKSGAFAAMRDPAKLLPMYRGAIKRRPDLLGGCYVIPDSTARHAEALGSLSSLAPLERRVRGLASVFTCSKMRSAARDALADCSASIVRTIRSMSSPHSS